MTLIYNTTDIKDIIIQEVARIVIPDNTPPVNSITLRNKQEGATHGNWGKFYRQEYRITLCVPEAKLLRNFHTKRLYTKIECVYETNLDFLAAVLGHEYYHAYQWTNPELRKYYEVDGWREVEAERYEQVALEKWRSHMDSLGVYKAVATGERK